jgi:hypothetical protein
MMQQKVIGAIDAVVFGHQRTPVVRSQSAVSVMRLGASTGERD